MTEERVSLPASEGWTVFIPFVVAAFLALLPLLVASRTIARTMRILVAALFGLGVLAALASIGMFFVPALVAMLLAAVIDDRFEVRPVPTPSR